MITCFQMELYKWPKNYWATSSSKVDSHVSYFVLIPSTGVNASGINTESALGLRLQSLVDAFSTVTA